MKAKLLLALSAGLVVALLAGGCFGDGNNGTTTSSSTQATGVTTIVPSVPVAPPVPTAAPTTATTAPAPTPTTVAAPPPSGSLSYTVASGDTLAAIAERFRVSVDAIVAASNLDDPDVLSVGQVLTIPTGGSSGGTGSGPATTVTGTTAPTGERQHVVVSGDTLSGIASRYNVSVDAIVEANGLASPDSLSVDYVLIIPSS